MIYGQLTITKKDELVEESVVVDIDAEAMNMGRSIENDIVISSIFVSSRHGYLKFIGDELYYMDKGSTNGSYYNEKRVRASDGNHIYPQKIEENGILFIGDTQTGNGVYIRYNKVDGRYIKEDVKPMIDIPEEHAVLVVITCEEGNKKINTYAIKDEKLSIGRRTKESVEKCQIPSSLISKQQGEIELSKGHFYYSEKGSNQFCFNGNKPDVIRDGNPRKLKDGDVLTIGEMKSSKWVLLYFTTSVHNQHTWNMKEISNGEISIGRSSENGICLPLLTVSRKHARILKLPQSAMIENLKSTNGILVNNEYVRKNRNLKNGDSIDIVSARIVYFDEFLLFALPHQVEAENTAGRMEYSFQGGMTVELNKISRIVPCKNGTGINGGSKKYILQNVSCTIPAGSLVAILGGSGAGKTTFMNCINGFEPATSGTVKINGKELYKNYNALKSRIGYVPQQDIVHDELSLRSMLKYVAKLRLPKDLTKEEIDKKVKEVIEMVDLTPHSNTVIKKMSGGQRKRASIAVELLSDPELFFLDEPTSGLDPEAETNLMKQLKTLANDKGKTVIVITHTLQNIHLFDKVVFLAPGGRLCFYGSPDKAKKFFEVDNLSEAYEKISADIDVYVNKFEAERKTK